MVTLHDRRKLEQQRGALLAELRGLGNLMRGSFGERGIKCGRPGCACALESHMRKALQQYHGGWRDQPTDLYCVEQDLVVADEYRDRNVGAGMRTLRSMS